MPDTSQERLEKIITDIATKVATDIYNKLGTQYSIANVPAHQHNGVDSNQIPLQGVQESIAIDGSPGGVFNPTILDTQKVNSQYASGKIDPASVYTLPVNIIYGNGVGVHSAFNGGNAKSGTMVFFENGLTLSALWVKTDNGWYGISPDLTA